MNNRETLERRIYFYDTTLRDGNQTPFGHRLSVADKLRLVSVLVKAGIREVEGGWPASNPTDISFFEEVKGVDLGASKLASFGMTGRVGVKPDDDDQLNLLLKSETDLVTVFGKSWMLHVTDVLGTTGLKNLDTIYRTVEYLKKQGRQVYYDAEHFFDGYKENPEYALESLRAARVGGASTIILCDTRGARGPRLIYNATRAVKEDLGENYPLGIHVHNDRGQGLWNTLEGVRAGVEQIQGVINLGGERAGNVDLLQVANIDTGEDFDPIEELGFLPVLDFDKRKSVWLSREVARITGRPVPNNYPHTGRMVHSDVGGTHADGTRKNFRTNHLYDPKEVGGEYYLINSDQGGGANVIAMAEKHGFPLTKNDPEVALLREAMKDLQDLGDSQAFLILWKNLVGDNEPFSVNRIQLLDDTNLDQPEVAVEMLIDGISYTTKAKGDGPIDAFDKAIRKKLLNIFPELSKVELGVFETPPTYEAGTDVDVTVCGTYKNNGDEWTSVVRGPDIVRASMESITQAYKHYLLRCMNRTSKTWSGKANTLPKEGL